MRCCVTHTAATTGELPTLRALPDVWHGMVHLQHLTLRHNLLVSEDFPPSFGQLPSLTSLDLSNNQLAYIPDCITACAPLVRLVLNTNEIQQLPDAIVAMPNLEVLHVGNNRIRVLPDEIGSLVSIRSLKVDWNALEELPPSFAELCNLEEFTAEGCPMRIPTQEVIIRGPTAVRRWCETSTDSTVFRHRQRTCAVKRADCETLHSLARRAYRGGSRSSARVRTSFEVQPRRPCVFATRRDAYRPELWTPARILWHCDRCIDYQGTLLLLGAHMHLYCVLIYLPTAQILPAVNMWRAAIYGHAKSSFHTTAEEVEGALSTSTRCWLALLCPCSLSA